MSLSCSFPLSRIRRKNKTRGTPCGGFRMCFHSGGTGSVMVFRRNPKESVGFCGSRRGAGPRKRRSLHKQTFFFSRRLERFIERSEPTEDLFRQLPKLVSRNKPFVATLYQPRPVFILALVIDYSSQGQGGTLIPQERALPAGADCVSGYSKAHPEDGDFVIFLGKSQCRCHMVGWFPLISRLR